METFFRGAFRACGGMLRQRLSAPRDARMNLSSDDFLRLESLVYRRISPRPDWLKAWRNEANYILFCARRAEDTDDVELLEELEDQAREMADMIEGRLRAEGLE